MGQLSERLGEWLEQIRGSVSAELSPWERREYGKGSATVTAWVASGGPVRLIRGVAFETEDYRGWNVAAFPAIGLQAPIFGLDIFWEGDVWSTVIVDLWSDGSISQGDFDQQLLGPLLELEVDWRRGSELSGPAARLLSDVGLMARNPEGVVSGEEGAELVGELLVDYLEGLDGAETQRVPASVEMQRAFCRLHADKPGGREMLVGLMGAEQTDAFVSEVFYPAPEPVD